jgi:Na+/H+ antiporter NhaD/arsenite permease-like protein
MTAVFIVFALVYLGMAAGKLPGLALDRTGVALLGAIAMVSLGALPFDDAWASVDMSTIYLLFALMVLSSQLRLAGFYSALVRRMVALEFAPHALLAVVLVAAGVLSAVLTNDIVCLAVTPMLVEGCTRRKLDPVPFLLGLSCASNVGSAATLIGNPQNILIGQALHLSFGRFLVQAGVPALLGLGAIWLVITFQFRGQWTGELPVVEVKAPPFSSWQSVKGLVAVAALVVVFLFFHETHRDGAALVCAGILLLSRRMASREMLGLVDWQLLLLFIGLFIVNGAFAHTGAMDGALVAIRGFGLDPSHPGWLFGLSAVLSNLVSNVPATMLLLPAATHELAGPVLALSSTLAGNLIIVGSIANIIVVTAAKPLGVEIGFRKHARTGIPVTLLTLAIAAVWLRIVG